MDFKKLTDEAKDLVDKRGGTDSLKEDAEELKGIIGGEGSLADKAKEAADAVKDPGASGSDEPAAEPASDGRRAGRTGQGRKGGGGGGGHRNRRVGRRRDR